MLEQQEWYEVVDGVDGGFLGQATLREGTVADWAIILHPAAIKGAIEKIVQKAVAGQEYNKHIMATIVVRVRPWRPPIKDIMEIGGGIPQVGCGNGWHYTSHDQLSDCPDCEDRKFITFTPDDYLMALSRYYEIKGHDDDPRAGNPTN